MWEQLFGHVDKGAHMKAMFELTTRMNSLARIVVGPANISATTALRVRVHCVCGGGRRALPIHRKAVAERPGHITTGVSLRQTSCRLRWYRSPASTPCCYLADVCVRLAAAAAGHRAEWVGGGAAAGLQRADAHPHTNKVSSYGQPVTCPPDKQCTLSTLSTRTLLKAQAR